MNEFLREFVGEFSNLPIQTWLVVAVCVGIIVFIRRYVTTPSPIREPGGTPPDRENIPQRLWCKKCHATGTVHVTVTLGPGNHHHSERTCPRCHGRRIDPDFWD